MKRLETREQLSSTMTDSHLFPMSQFIQANNMFILKPQYGPNKALQPTPSRFALGVARTVNFQKITSQIRLPVQGG